MSHESIELSNSKTIKDNQKMLMTMKSFDNFVEDKNNDQ